jgi:hypothetical protein
MALNVSLDTSFDSIQDYHSKTVEHIDMIQALICQEMSEDFVLT